MTSSTFSEVSKNLGEAMKILGERELESGPEIQSQSRTSIPGPLHADGQDVSVLLHLVHNLIHDEQEPESSPHRRVYSVSDQGHTALLGHSLSAYVSVLDRDRIRKLTTRILSDSTVWLCRLFRYDSGSVCFHDDDRDGLVKVCRLVINSRYEDYATEGYSALNAQQPVIYQSASCRPSLGQHLCCQLGLPLSSLCTVPCNTLFGSQHQMDVALLDKLIREDVDAGKLPLLLIANAGTPGAGHTDKLSRLKDLCDQYKMWLHVEGVNLATLALTQVSSAVLAASRSDSMTLTPGQWLGLPAVSAVTLYRHEDPALSLAAGLTSSRPAEKLRALPLWLSLQCLGHNAIVQKIQHAAALSQELLQKLKPVSSIKISVEDELSPVVLFKFCSSEADGRSTDGYCAGERETLDTFNRWLGDQLTLSIPSCGVQVVELEDEGTCVRFSPLLTAAVVGTELEDVERLVEKLKDLLPSMSSTLDLRRDFMEQIHRHSGTLSYVEDLAWPGLGAVRFEPQADGLSDSKRNQEVEKINAELLRKLQELDTDIVFSAGPEFGAEQDCVFVGMVSEDVDVPQLVDTMAALGTDIEESGRLLDNMTEVVRKGIQEAELQLQRANEDRLREEGMLRQLPLVSSVLNWFAPVETSIKGQSFNLAAGALDSSETTYSTKAQPGRPSPQDLPSSPSSSSMRPPGQRLFQRPVFISDSLSETGFSEKVETPTDSSPTSTSTPSTTTPTDSSSTTTTAPPASDEHVHTPESAHVTPEHTQEESEDSEEVSEERQPDGAEEEEEESGR